MEVVGFIFFFAGDLHRKNWVLLYNFSKLTPFTKFNLPKTILQHKRIEGDNGESATRTTIKKGMKVGRGKN